MTKTNITIDNKEAHSKTIFDQKRKLKSVKEAMKNNSPRQRLRTHESFIQKCTALITFIITKKVAWGCNVSF